MGSLDLFAKAHHHLEVLRGAAQGKLLSSWWVSRHAYLLASTLSRLEDWPKPGRHLAVEDAVAAFGHVPGGRIEPGRAFAAEVLFNCEFDLTGALVAQLLRLEPTEHAFDRLRVPPRNFWLDPDDLLSAMQADPKFVAGYVARHESEILDPFSVFQERHVGVSPLERIVRLVETHTPEEMPRLRFHQQRAHFVRAFWESVSDYSDTDHSDELAAAIDGLDKLDPDAHQLIGSRAALAEATGYVRNLPLADRAPLDRAFLWHSVLTGVGIGDDAEVFDHLHEEQSYVLDPLHSGRAPNRGAPFVLPATLVEALSRIVELTAVTSERDAVIRDQTVRHRRQVLGRIVLMAQVAHRTPASLAACADLVVALVTHPRAFEWPLATAAFVLHCLREDAHGAEAIALIGRLGRAPIPIDVLVCLQIMGAFGQSYLERPSVQYTVANLLKKDSGAERAMMTALADYGETLLESPRSDYQEGGKSGPSGPGWIAHGP